jgi:ABC-type multidrug transport system ATPase subunit
VAVLRSGKMVAQGTVEELTRRRSAKYKLIATAIDDALLAQFRAERVNGHIELSVDDLQQLNLMLDQIRARGGLVSELSPLRSSLEDVFVDLVRA